MKAYILISILFTIFVYTQAQSSDYSPIYTLGNPRVNSKVYNVSLVETNLNTKSHEIITSFNWEHESFTEIYGGGIYYETGVLYGNYWAIASGKFVRSYLLAINVTNGEILFENLPYSEGIVYGIAIDQTSGNIHFLNFTQNVISHGGVSNSGDWCIFHTDTQETTIYKKNAVQNFNGAEPSQYVYDYLTNSLWTLASDKLFQISPSGVITTPYTGEKGFTYQLTMNPKNNQMYIITYNVRIYISPAGEDHVHLYAYYVDNTNPNDVTFTAICDYYYHNERIGAFALKPYDIDVDYVSNSLTSLIHLSVDITQSLNVLTTFNLDDCTTYEVSAIDDGLLYSFPRFYPN